MPASRTARAILRPPFGHIARGVRVSMLSRLYPSFESVASELCSEVRMPPAAELGQLSFDELTHMRQVLQRLTALRVDNPHDVEDIVQETLLTMTVRCSGIDLEKSVLIWGMGVLRRKVGNYYRRAQRRSGLDFELFDPDTANTPWIGPSPESTLRHAELQALLRALLTRFPVGEKAVMELLLAGLPTSEIVERLHPERYQNVVNWVHRGRRRLLRELARYGYVAPSGTEGRRRRRKGWATNS